MWAAVGCGSLLLIAFILMGVVGWYVASNAKSIAADGVVIVSERILQDSGMPEAQREQVVARVRRIADGFKSGDVTLEDLEKFGEKLAEDKAIIASGLLYFIDSQVLKNSDLDEDQRERAGRALQRVARGVVEDKIELESLEGLVNEFLDPPGNDGNRQLKKNLTSEEVEEVIATATELADQAEVPDEPFEIDIVEHIDSIIDEVLEPSPDAEMPNAEVPEAEMPDAQMPEAEPSTLEPVE